MLKKPFEIVSGFGLLLAGLVLSIPGVPGPGFLVIIGGLVVLARHFHWARRALDAVKARWEKLKSKLKQPK